MKKTIKKPTIAKNRRGWSCTGAGTVRIGTTPEEAYKLWLETRERRLEMKRMNHSERMKEKPAVSVYEGIKATPRVPEHRPPLRISEVMRRNLDRAQFQPPMVGMVSGVRRHAVGDAR